MRILTKTCGFSEIVTNALRHTEVHLNLQQYPTCPRLIRHVATPGHILPVHYDSMVSLMLKDMKDVHFTLLSVICLSKIYL